MTRFIFSAILLYLISTPAALADTVLIEGRLMDQISHEALVGAEIISGDRGTISDVDGRFTFRCQQNELLTIQLIGYKPFTAPAKQTGSMDIYLSPEVLEGQSIDVAASRVIPGITPVAYTTIRSREIGLHYATEDVPMVLSSATGVHAYSESGNGTGYSYVSIRGFDQSRIAVMLDNVPLNDNESHQVYWVDHGDILSDAEDVEIQRGVGNSLYGATAFGGSININTKIKSQNESFNVKILKGSYATEKYRVGYHSGARLGDHLSLTLRGSMLNSQGYRKDSASDQTSFMGGLEHRQGSWVNQLRVTLGKEISILQWDGVTESMLADDDARREKLPWTEPFTDDFYQQIYSLNTRYLLNPHSVIRNVAYLVKGSGYYAKDDFGSFYEYNLDVEDVYPDAVEETLYTTLHRKKWIQNTYYGVVPVWTYESSSWRSDLGLELRQYQGDHFGEVSAIDDSLLNSQLPASYRYYDYMGQKRLTTAFAHLLYELTPTLTAAADLQIQRIRWDLDQTIIGHAPGVDLTADWTFINPRLGLSYAISEGLNIFAGYGQAQKEPADAQIIEADDVFSQPQDAPVERVKNYEFGLNWYSGPAHLKLNLYQIRFENEVLRDIYNFEEGVYDIESADQTLHQGLEFDLGTTIQHDLELNLNGSLAEYRFSEGALNGQHLANVPGSLMNLRLSYKINSNLNSSFMLKHVGKQYIDQENTADLAIPAYQLVSIFMQYEFGGAQLELRVNNALDQRYATYGYVWGEGYYWPGAARNYSLAVNYVFQ